MIGTLNWFRFTVLNKNSSDSNSDFAFPSQILYFHFPQKMQAADSLCMSQFSVAYWSPLCGCRTENNFAQILWLFSTANVSNLITFYWSFFCSNDNCLGGKRNCLFFPRRLFYEWEGTEFFWREQKNWEYPAQATREKTLCKVQLSFATARLVLKLKHLRGFEQLFNSFNLKVWK